MGGMDIASTMTRQPILVVFCAASWAPPGAPPAARLWSWILRTRLRPGFSHCFALIHVADRSWIVFDPLSIGICVAPLVATRAAIDDWLTGMGATVVETRARRDAMLGFGPLTCVTAIKALLGRRSWVVTPWQLYRHLTKEA